MGSHQLILAIVGSINYAKKASRSRDHSRMCVNGGQCGGGKMSELVFVKSSDYVYGLEKGC